MAARKSNKKTTRILKSSHGKRKIKSDHPFKVMTRREATRIEKDAKPLRDIVHSNIPSL
jgi:hypothetical protein